MTQKHQIPELEVPMEAPQEILSKIRNAWIAGLISMVITVVLTVISISGTDIFGLDATAFIDVFLMAIFVYGVHKKSRICAILMLLLFAANKALMWAENGMANGLILSVVFFWFYTQGVIGTFEYHNILKKVTSKTDVFNSGERNKTDSITGLATKPLKIQATIVSDDYGVIPDLAKSNWCIGYVGGFTDAVLQQAKIPLNEEAFTIVSVVYETLFGKEDGPAYFKKFMDLQRAENDELFQGMSVGGSEFLSWITDNEKIPLGWANHVLDVEET